jgi:hypothetical protein
MHAVVRETFYEPSRWSTRLLARQSYQFADAFNIFRSEEERELKAPPTTLKGPPAYQRDAPDA